MLLFKSYFKKRQMVKSSSSILFQTDIFRGYQFRIQAFKREEIAVGTAPAASDVYIMYQFRKYCHPFEWLELSVPKNSCHPFEKLAEAIRFKKIANFSNPLSQDVNHAKENYQPFELVQAFPKTLFLLLSYEAEVCFRVQQTLS